MVWNSEEEILAFARLLEGKSIDECPRTYRLSSVYEHAGKGGYGQYLENAYFGLETNNLSRPDFYPVQLELKASSLIKNKRTGKLQPKERLVLNVVDYNAVVKEPSLTKFVALTELATMVPPFWILPASSELKSRKSLDMSSQPS